MQDSPCDLFRRSDEVGEKGYPGLSQFVPQFSREALGRQDKCGAEGVSCGGVPELRETERPSLAGKNGIDGGMGHRLQYQYLVVPFLLG